MAEGSISGPTAAISDFYTRSVYAFSHETETPPSTASFMGDLPALTRARSGLARNPSARASYGGSSVVHCFFRGADASNRKVG